MRYIPAKFGPPTRLTLHGVKHLLVIAAVILVLGFLVYRWRSTKDQLQVEPHARQEIEKARRR